MQFNWKKQNTAKLTLFLLGLFTLITNSTANATELKGNPEELKRFLHPTGDIVTLKGEAKRTAYSDKAIVNLIITTEEDELASALQKNSEIRNTIITQLTSKGVDGKNINTSKFSTSPQFGWFGDSPSSFEIVNRMSIIIFDEKQMIAIAKLSDANKEIELSSTSYEHTKKKEFLLNVKKKALEDALKQKTFYEESLGVKLVTKNFRDPSVRFGATKGSGDFNRRITATGSRLKKPKPKISYAEIPAPAPQSFDEVEYKATIHVDFIVTAKK